MLGSPGPRWRSWLAALVLGAGALSACGDDHTPTDAPVLTVEQLVARSADGSISVQGFLIEKDGVTRLCAAVMESYPPQCGEPAVELVRLDLDEVAGTQTDQGVTWKEWVVMTVQRRQDARFDVISLGSD